MAKNYRTVACVIYRWMDRLFDPPPKDLRKAGNEASIVLYYESQDESYNRYKHLCYRNLILESLLAFIFGLFTAAVLKL